MDWSPESLEVQRPASRQLQQRSRQEIMRLEAGGVEGKDQLLEVFLSGPEQGPGTNLMRNGT